MLAVGLSRNGLAFLIPALIALGLTWLLLAGSGPLQAAFAVGIAWFLLFGGLLDNLRNLSGRTGDGHALARTTLIPGFVWKPHLAFSSLSSPSSSAASSSSDRGTTSARDSHPCGPRRRET